MFCMDSKELEEEVGANSSLLDMAKQEVRPWSRYYVSMQTNPLLIEKYVV